MASVFQDVDATLSAIVPKQITAFNTYDGSASAQLTQSLASGGNLTADITPSIAGNMTGVVVFASIANFSTTTSDSDVLTVKLQENVASVWTDRASGTVTKGTLKQPFGDACSTVPYCVPFSASYAVDTSAGKWRIHVSQNGAGTWYLGRNGTPISYACILDSTTTLATNDTLWIKHDCTLTVNMSYTLVAVYPGKNVTIRWVDSPAASYTFSVTGGIYGSSNTHIVVGSQQNPVPVAQKAVWKAKLIWNSGWSWVGFNELLLWGERPANWVAYVANTVSASNTTNQFQTTVDMSAYWVPGDVIFLTGSSDQQCRRNTISSISGTTVTLTSNLDASANQKIAAGTFAINYTRYMNGCGVEYEHLTSSNDLGSMLNVQMSGVYYKTASYASAGGESFIHSAVHNARILPFVFQDFMPLIQGSDRVTWCQFGQRPVAESAYRKNNIYENFFLLGGTNMFGVYLRTGYGTTNTITRMALHPSTPGSEVASKTIICGATVTDLHISNRRLATETTGFYLDLVDTQVTGFKVLGGYPGVYLSMVSSSITNATVDAYSPELGLIFRTCAKSRITNVTFGGIYTAAYDIGDRPAFVDLDMLNRSANCTIENSTLVSAATGSQLRCHLINNTANNHAVYMPNGIVTCEASVVHTNGGLAIRFQPLSSTSLLTWQFKTPTGNIQTKTMTVAVWVKISNAAFYAGTHQKPRLNVNYDNGTVAYAEAAGNTDWQLLSVTFTPATTYGELTIALDCRTDATGSNAYVYWDDFAVLYPPGHRLDLGAMDLWADALPITPPIATVLSANDVWTANLASMAATGNAAQKVLDASGSQAQADVQAAMTAQGYTTTRGGYLDTLNGLVAAVWASVSRTLTAISDSAGITTLLSRIASALTITGGKVDVNDKTGFAPTVVENRQEMDANSTRLALAEKIARNKMVTDPATGIVTLYDDDGTTPLLSAALKEDAAGTQAYRGQGAERRERLT